MTFAKNRLARYAILFAIGVYCLWCVLLSYFKGPAFNMMKRFWWPVPFTCYLFLRGEY